jgi:hypothetical protein
LTEPEETPETADGEAADPSADSPSA